MKTNSVDQIPAPADRNNFVYVIFYWLGIGTLLPWNFFISVSEYWKTKWRTVDAVDNIMAFEADGNSTVVGDGLNATSAPSLGGVNQMQTNWSSHLAVASMVPNVTMLTLNAIFGHKFKTQPRLLISLCLVIVLFIFTDVMAKVDTDGWQDEFYVVTLVSVVLININAAIFQGGLLGVAGKFPPRYMGGVFSGQALGGIFASATNLIFLACGADVVDAAFYSFLIAVLFLGTALVGFVAVSRSNFYQFFVDEEPAAKLKALPGSGEGDAEAEEKKKLSAEDEAKVPEVKIPKKVSPLHILGKIFFYAVSVFLIFGVTLGVFPAITVLIVSVDSGSAWTDTYFIPVVCFLLFNVGDYVGRTLAEWLRWPKPGRLGATLTLVLSLLRVAFVPLFVLCNANPLNRSTTEVVFASDEAYIVFMILFSVSNGYLASMCMMSAPQVCEPDEQQTAASLMVAILGLGLGTGSALSNLFVKLV